METIKIEFQSSVKEKLIDFLNSFSKSELHIVNEDSSDSDDDYYKDYREMLHLAVKRHEAGESKTYSIDELDAMLEKTISKYEN